MKGERKGKGIAAAGEVRPVSRIVIPAKAGIQTSRMKLYFVYIMANKRNDTPSIGITGDLAKRVFQHKHGSADSFTRKYKVYKLVYYEPCGDVYQAIIREKQPKKWNRTWKLDLIESENPSWRDLSEDFS